MLFVVWIYCLAVILTKKWLRNITTYLPILRDIKAEFQRTKMTKTFLKLMLNFMVGRYLGNWLNILENLVDLLRQVFSQRAFESNWIYRGFPCVYKLSSILLSWRIFFKKSLKVIKKSHTRSSRVLLLAPRGAIPKWRHPRWGRVGFTKSWR